MNDMGIERIFGYGSLIWKPPPYVVDQIPCYVKGFKRKFAQLSHDHRGTPTKPGVVVTLIPKVEWMKLIESSEDKKDDDDKVWGMMYTIDPTKTNQVQTYLDEREQDGYEKIQIDIYTIENNLERCIGKSTTYLGHVTNPSFYRHRQIEELVNQIHSSVGPSGSNKEYLYLLKEKVDALSPQSYDPYLHHLESLVRKLDENLIS